MTKKFKVGDRVIGMRSLLPEHKRANAGKGRPGMVGTVVRIPGHRCIHDYFVVFDDMKSSFIQGAFSLREYQLEPLEDPKADAFIETVKKWKPEPETPKVPQKIRA